MDAKLEQKSVEFAKRIEMKKGEGWIEILNFFNINFKTGPLGDNSSFFIHCPNCVATSSSNRHTITLMRDGSLYPRWDCLTGKCNKRLGSSYVSLIGYLAKLSPDEVLEKIEDFLNGVKPKPMWSPLEEPKRRRMKKSQPTAGGIENAN